MAWNSPTTELTTAGTDLLLGVLSGAVAVALPRLDSRERWKVGIWTWLFWLLALGAMLGTVVHGFAWTEATRSILWMPLYLSLGITVALFAAGALYDWSGLTASRRALPWLFAVGILFFGVTQIGDSTFLWFVIYETVAMVAALCVYAFLWAARRRPGAAMMTAGVALSILAAAIQARTKFHFTLIWPVNRDGIFHLVQMAGVVALWIGLKQSLLSPAGLKTSPGSAPGAGKQSP